MDKKVFNRGQRARRLLCLALAFVFLGMAIGVQAFANGADENPLPEAPVTSAPPAEEPPPEPPPPASQVPGSEAPAEPSSPEPASSAPSSRQEEPSSSNAASSPDGSASASESVSAAPASSSGADQAGSSSLPASRLEEEILMVPMALPVYSVDAAAQDFSGLRPGDKFVLTFTVTAQDIPLADLTLGFSAEQLELVDDSSPRQPPNALFGNVGGFYETKLNNSYYYLNKTDPAVPAVRVYQINKTVRVASTASVGDLTISTYLYEQGNALVPKVLGNSVVVSVNAYPANTDYPARYPFGNAIPAYTGACGVDAAENAGSVQAVIPAGTTSDYVVVSFTAAQLGNVLRAMNQNPNNSPDGLFKLPNQYYEGAFELLNKSGTSYEAVNFHVDPHSSFHAHPSYNLSQAMVNTLRSNMGQAYVDFRNTPTYTNWLANPNLANTQQLIIHLDSDLAVQNAGGQDVAGFGRLLFDTYSSGGVFGHDAAIRAGNYWLGAACDAAVPDTYLREYGGPTYATDIVNYYLAHNAWLRFGPYAGNSAAVQTSRNLLINYLYGSVNTAAVQAMMGAMGQLPAGQSKTIQFNMSLASQYTNVAFNTADQYADINFVMVLKKVTPASSSQPPASSSQPPVSSSSVPVVSSSSGNPPASSSASSSSTVRPPASSAAPVSSRSAPPSRFVPVVSSVVGGLSPTPVSSAPSSVAVSSGGLPTQISNVPIPIVSPPVDEGAWALANLILALLSAAVGLVLLIGMIVKSNRDTKAEEEEQELPAAQQAAADAQAQTDEEEEEPKNKRSMAGLWRLIAIAIGVLSPIVFLLTENMRLRMELVDRWTIWMVVISAMQAVVLLMMHFASRREEEEQQENQSPTQQDRR